MKAEVEVLGSLVSNSPYGLCGHKATLKHQPSELRSCVEENVDVPGSLSLIVCVVSVAVKQQ